MKTMAKKIALVTGANRGLGLETSRQLGRAGYHVLMGGRDAVKTKQAAEQLRKEGFEATPLTLDVTRDESVAQAAELVSREYQRLDALVNNAGIMLDADQPSSAGLKVSVDVLKETFETNVYGPYRMIQRFAPLMIRTSELPNGAPRIVNLSSGMGQLSEMNGGYPAYRASKTALNALTRVFAEELASHQILVNSVCPGWVKTDMGGDGAELTPEQGADTIFWAATLPAGGPTGGFFREREAIAW